MSFSQLTIKEETEVETVFVAEEIESSEDPPPEEWSSLICLENPFIEPKKILYEQGLYDPGSGEICAKYIVASDSSIFRHIFYKYPSIPDPGIEDALLRPIKSIEYSNDGQELYLALCKEINIFPIRMFYKQLLEDTVNLRFYGINPEGIRPIAMALQYNRIVKVLDLTDNWINEDGCYHFGEMLLDNVTLKEINLTGCRIGPHGAERLVYNLLFNRGLRIINLSKNQLGDEGVEHIANAIYEGSDIINLNLSYNNLTSKSATFLAEAFENTNILTHLDMSWNSMLAPAGLNLLSAKLLENEALVEVNLAWNSLTPRFANAIKNILLSPNLQHLDLSNNNLKDEAITTIKLNLTSCKKLEILNLSGNPMKPEEAISILLKLKLRKVKLNQLLLDHVCVTVEFVEQRDQILQLRHRKGAIITHGDVRPRFDPIGGDMRKIVFRRADVLCSKPKKKAVDIAVIILTYYKHHKEPILPNELSRLFATEGAFQMNEDLVAEMARAFPGPKKGRDRTVNMSDLVDYIHRIWPDRKPIPTPPPEPEPVPEPPRKKGKKGNGKKK